MSDFCALRTSSIASLRATFDDAFEAYGIAIEEQRTLAIEWSREIEAVRNTCTSPVERAASDAGRAYTRMRAAARALAALLEAP